MNALESLLNAIEDELGEEGLKALDDMITISQSREYQEFAEIIEKAETERERTPAELAVIAFNIFKKKGRNKTNGTVQE